MYMITQQEFNENAYCSVIAYIDDILSISPDAFRADFVLSINSEQNIIIESWNVEGITQPSIENIRQALTMERVNICINALS